jgi:hypothetical protein
MKCLRHSALLNNGSSIRDLWMARKMLHDVTMEAKVSSLLLSKNDLKALLARSERVVWKVN